ncbi:hypothetical protein C476_03443 [Natrinema limicola JCM 13563]|uniref:Uncharacterized protein n=1 Tax=Natrinema limicola JCM 13563 TaxID=1230457 RepID=M0CPX3_9EURY|nr:hypothetical protein C476_03443 [Natrinema limicola JCM 13563]
MSAHVFYHFPVPIKTTVTLPIAINGKQFVMSVVSLRAHRFRCDAQIATQHNYSLDETGADRRL